MFEDIDSTIASVERLYRTVSGHDAGTAEGAPMPPEKDASAHLDDQVDRLITTLGQVTGAAPQPPRAWAPLVAVYERPDAVIICIDLPGVAKDTVDVQAAGALLRISGRRGPACEPTEARQLSSEAPQGLFRRDIALPPSANGEGLTASLKDGVLELRVPKAAKATPKSFTVQ